MRILLALCTVLTLGLYAPAFADVPDAAVVHLADGGGDNGIGTSPSEPASASITTTTSTTIALNVPDPEKDPGGFISAVLSSARSGNWRLFVAILLIGVVALARLTLGKSSWFRTDRGGAALVLGLALVGGIATSLAAEKFSIGVLVNSMLVAFTAAGGYALVKKLFTPSDVKPTASAFTHLGNGS